MISVIIPVYNGEKYLNECLDSIVGVNTEIIVINDGSTDNTKKIASEYTKSVINTDRIGPVRARNIGINKSNNEYLMFMDADDILTQNAIDILREQISDNDMVIGLRQDFISPDCVNKSVDIKTSGHTVIAGCALMKKSAFDKIGLFDEDLMCGDSYDWILRAQKAGLAIKRIDNILCLRRIHDTNMGRMLKEQEYADYCKIIRKHFVKK